MKFVTRAVFLLSLAWLMGCSSESEAVKKAQADADAAKEELAKVRAELDAAKTELARGKSPPAAEEAVRKVVCDFFVDLNQARDRSAYEFMSDPYRKRVDRKGFNEFMEKHPALRGVVNFGNPLLPQFRLIKIRKLAKDNVYECDSTGFHDSTGVEAIFTLRVVQEAGAWKIDDFVELKERKHR
jgi:hypothetical protein